jgi:hypothetical protein
VVQLGGSKMSYDELPYSLEDEEVEAINEVEYGKEAEILYENI